jgi:hypothetical protein
MNEAIRYDNGLGNAEIYARVTNGLSYYNFSSALWVGYDAIGCRVFMHEYPDNSTTQSWYAIALPLIPAGGPYGVDIVRLSSGLVIGNDIIPQSTDVVLPILSSLTTVEDIFDVVLQRLAAIKKPIQLDFFTSLNLAVDIIFRRLLVRRSEIVQGSFAQAVTAPATYSSASTYAIGTYVNYGNHIYLCNTTISVPEAFNATHWTSIDSTTSPVSITLPGDFFGFSERPYIQGRRCLLEPLPVEAKATISSPATPLFYELRGNTATLYPIPTENITVMAQYYKKPAKLTALTDGIPFNELFIFAIQEAVIDICQIGVAAVVDKTFTAVLYKQIDEILPFRAPRQVRFRQTIEGGQRAAMGSTPYYFN